MMVIRGTVGPEGNANRLFNHIFPADRCTWQQIDDASGRGYGITDVRYYPGTTSTLGGESAPVHTIADAELGFIGKSGRFVEITT